MLDKFFFDVTVFIIALWTEGEPNGVKERNFIFNLKKNKFNIIYFSENQATLFCPLVVIGTGGSQGIWQNKELVLYSPEI